MSFCPKCGNENAQAARFCGKCGAPLPTRATTSAAAFNSAPAPASARSQASATSGNARPDAVHTYRADSLHPARTRVPALIVLGIVAIALLGAVIFLIKPFGGGAPSGNGAQSTEEEAFAPRDYEDWLRSQGLYDRMVIDNETEMKMYLSAFSFGGIIDYSCDIEENLIINTVVIGPSSDETGVLDNFGYQALAGMIVEGFGKNLGGSLRNLETQTGISGITERIEVRYSDGGLITSQDFKATAEENTATAVS